MKIKMSKLSSVGDIYRRALDDSLTVSQYAFGGADKTFGGVFCKQCDNLTFKLLERLVGCADMVTTGDYKDVSENVTGAMKCFSILEHCTPDQITLENEQEVYYYKFLLKEIGGLYD